MDSHWTALNQLIQSLIDTQREFQEALREAQRERTETKEQLIALKEKAEKTENVASELKDYLDGELKKRENSTIKTVALVGTGAAIASGQLDWNKIIEKILSILK